MQKNKAAGVWVFIALLALGALLFASLLSTSRTSILPTPLGLPWYVMIALSAFGEMCLFSVRYRNDAQTFTLGEISYVLGAVFFRPREFLVASLIGLSLVFFARKARMTHLVFNVSTNIIGSCIVITAARLFGGSNSQTDSARLWFGVILGAALACPVQALLVGLVRSVAEGRLSALTDAPRVILFSELNSVAIASMGVLTGIVLSVAPGVAIIAAVPLALLFVAFSQLVREHTQRTNVEFLYETAQSIHNTADIELALTGLLRRAMTSFYSDFGAVWLPRPDSNQWVSFCVGETSSGLHSLDERPQWIPAPGVALVCDRRRAEPSQLQLLDQLGANRAMVCTLKIDDDAFGLLLFVANSDSKSVFSESDRRLFELLANQVAIGVENSQLERSLGVLTRLEEEMRHQATHDSLTGLANRSKLSATLEAVIAASTETHRGVLLIDLDDFKTVNDSLGHAAGDEVLIEVSRRLLAAVRENDLVARLGGDEFAIVLGTGASKERAIEVAERISLAMTPPITVAGRQLHMHASVGVATATTGVRLEELLRTADVAMYEAKNAGKGQHKIFESGMDDSARERLQIATGLKSAAANEELVIQYQPIVNLRLRNTVAVEALLRWNHPGLGWLGPDRFIPLAEETNSIIALGAWTLEKACFDIAPLTNEHGHPLELHVNVSPQQIAALDFVETVINILTKSGMEPNRLVLEITEKTALADSASVLANVNMLRTHSVQFALDDFGTGYSSLAAAHSFPLDSIKIDQLFVRTITAESDASLVRAILAMADSLGLKPVAEGIETTEQLEQLISFGADFGQGYLFSKPLPVEALPTWLHPAVLTSATD
jgi:diguanylate cyclase